MEFPTRRQFYLDVAKHALHVAWAAGHRLHSFLIILGGGLLVLLAIRLEEYKWAVALPFLTVVGVFFLALLDHAYSV
jgi:hypothetical protein